MSRLGAGRYVETAEMLAGTTTSVHRLVTHDDASVSGVLRVVPGARIVVCLMHPRQDVTHHGLVPELLAHGFAVWTQGARSVNNDIALVHEQTLLDVAAGQVFLRARGFDAVVTLGHSGGGTLFAFYHQQAGLRPHERLRTTAAGRPIPLGEAELPVPDGAIFLAPHPGQGALLARVIDPSVIEESDPMSRDPQLDPYATANGFNPEPGQTRYDPGFVERYRAAQLERIRRIDAVAQQRVAEAATARARAKESDDPDERRRMLAPRLLTVYRTDADLRSGDLSLDPNERRHGSLFGRRPDLTNYGLTGFGRLSTPDAWLSTWSINHTRADFLRCAPDVTVPTLLMELSGDQACFPADITRMNAALGAEDLSVGKVRGTHFGAPLDPGEPTGYHLAASEMAEWLRKRYATS